jgi:hypothetical protein
VLARCNSLWRTRNHLINAGPLALAIGDLAAASRAVLELARVPDAGDTLLASWQGQLNGRLALARERPGQALIAFRRALALSRRGGLWDSEHLALIGIGRSAERLGRVAAALAAYAAAERMMGPLLAGIPLGEGQAAFMHERQAASERLLELLVQRGEPEAALAIGRRARARVLRALSQPARMEHMTPALRARWEAAIARYHALRSELERTRAGEWRLPGDRRAAAGLQLDAQRERALGALDQAHALLTGERAQRDEPLARATAEEPLLALFPLATSTPTWFAAATTSRSARHLRAQRRRLSLRRRLLCSRPQDMRAASPAFGR